MKKVDIDSIIRILKKEVKQFHMPVVSEIGLRETPFKVLISCLLSLRTKDEVTAPASLRLFKRAGTPEKLAKLPIETIEKLIYPVGFYKTKAKNIKELSKNLIDNYSSKVPDTIEELVKLHGVGRKTANVVITTGFRKPGVAVDTHVHRITNRWGYIKTKTPDRSEQALRKILPRKHWMHITDLLVAWGQNICKPISPLCSQCKIRPYCNRIGVTTSR